MAANLFHDPLPVGYAFSSEALIELLRSIDEDYHQATTIQ
jgi:hypothetical protein